MNVNIICSLLLFDMKLDVFLLWNVDLGQKCQFISVQGQHMAQFNLVCWTSENTT